MKVVIFGATGMVGQGVLRECLLDPTVTQVLSVVRRTGNAITFTGTTPEQNAKLREIVAPNFQDFTAIEPELTGLDACYFCLGVTSAGMSEDAYTHITYNIPVAAAHSLLHTSPALTFIFISGQGADSTEQGRTMWARVKGRAENAVIAAGFRAAYVFRPGFIEPLDGIRSRTRMYNIAYFLFRPLVPIAKWIIPNDIITTRQIGQAMLGITRDGFATRILTNRALSTF
jgi:uncharacterized protein YbjT (DUF2867 family)